jgi:hypothetical protein
LIEMENNSNVKNAVKVAINDAKAYIGKKGQEGLEKAVDLLQKLEVKTLVEKKELIADYLNKAGQRGGLTEGEIVVLAAIYAANEALFPTSVLDLAGLGPGKAVSKAGTLMKNGDAKQYRVGRQDIQKTHHGGRRRGEPGVRVPYAHDPSRLGREQLCAGESSDGCDAALLRGKSLGCAARLAERLISKEKCLQPSQNIREQLLLL